MIKYQLVRPISFVARRKKNILKFPADKLEKLTGDHITYLLRFSEEEIREDLEKAKCEPATIESMLDTKRAAEKVVKDDEDKCRRKLEKLGYLTEEQIEALLGERRFNMLHPKIGESLQQLRLMNVVSPEGETVENPLLQEWTQLLEDESKRRKLARSDAGGWAEKEAARRQEPDPDKLDLPDH